jgi:hypothetical protein
MRTLLDEAESWFLETLTYAGELTVIVVEGIRSNTPEDKRVGSHVLKGLHAVEAAAGSRRAAIRFPRTIAWQVIDESYTAWDRSEVRDDKGFLVALTQSAYLQYVEAHHGWFKDVGPAAHYRLWTENEVIDVVAHEEPVVQRLEGR